MFTNPSLFEFNNDVCPAQSTAPLNWQMDTSSVAFNLCVLNDRCLLPANLQTCPSSPWGAVVGHNFLLLLIIASGKTRPTQWSWRKTHLPLKHVPLPLKIHDTRCQQIPTNPNATGVGGLAHAMCWPGKQGKEALSCQGEELDLTWKDSNVNAIGAKKNARKIPVSSLFSANDDGHHCSAANLLTITLKVGWKKNDDQVVWKLWWNWCNQKKCNNQTAMVPIACSQIVCCPICSIIWWHIIWWQWWPCQICGSLKMMNKQTINDIFCSVCTQWPPSSVWLSADTPALLDVLFLCMFQWHGLFIFRAPVVSILNHWPSFAANLMSDLKLLFRLSTLQLLPWQQCAILLLFLMLLVCFADVPIMWTMTQTLC